ncbi:MAG: MATE family efflux transporter, partial [Microvirga sp.]
PSLWMGLFSDDPEGARLGALYLRIVGPAYVCFGLALGLFFVSQGFGRGFGAMSANAARLLVSAGAGLAAVYWLDLGIAGFFTAIATGFVLYAALLAAIVLRVRTPERPA